LESYKKVRRMENVIQKAVENLQIIPVSKAYETQAMDQVLEGFIERFGFINHSLNLDLNAICDEYAPSNRLFLIGVINDEVLVTGGLVQEGTSTWRIVRMSVKKDYRRMGFAETMFKRLEAEAASVGCLTLVLETNINWESAIRFYQKMGFHIERQDEEQIHFYKNMKKVAE
jgi:ribosomal protein S18 acetylase RimI-like enzyme